MQDASYRAFFFDLDGTLLPMDLKEFLHNYVHLFTSYVSERGMRGSAFAHAISNSVSVVGKDTTDRCNADVFWDSFNADYGALDERERAIVNKFYEHEFGRLGDNVQPNPAAARAVSTLSDKGYPLVLTTMPLFPRKAIEWRLRWAGVDPSYFKRLTTYDNSNSVKPHAEYFRQNLELVGSQPQEVLMVGNNTVDDLSCMDIGMDAYLVTDCLINTNEYDISSVKHGSLDQFADFAETMPRYNA